MTMEEKIDDLYKRYAPMVLRRCRFLLKDEEEALDVMQETFIKLLKVKKLRETGCSSLLYITAGNLCLTRLKKNSRQDYLPLQEEFAGQAGTDKFSDEKLFLQSLFASEKESTQSIALLHYVDGLTLEQTAEMVGMSVSGIRKRLRNLRAKAIKMKNYNFAQNGC